MYELSHDLIGALSPMIVVLAMMMMTGGARSSSSYVFSGKTDDVGFLLLKARATARKLACAHRRTGNGLVLNGGPPISYAEFFDLSARPDDISEAIWQDMSETAFDTIISFIHDHCSWWQGLTCFQMVRWTHRPTPDQLEFQCSGSVDRTSWCRQLAPPHPRR